MSLSEGWYNGPSVFPRMVYVYRYRYTDVFKDGTETLENVRRYYDEVGTRFGFEFRLTNGFIVKLDYYPEHVDDLWSLGMTLYCGRRELGRIKKISTDDTGLKICCGSFEIFFSLPNVDAQVARVKRSEDVADDYEESEKNDAEFEANFHPESHPKKKARF